MKRSVCISGILPAFLVSLALGVSTASAEKLNCEDLSVGKMYVCQVKNSNTAVASTFSLEVLAGAPGDFHITQTDSGGTEAALACSCKVRGGMGGSPDGLRDTLRFEESRWLQCVGTLEHTEEPEDDFFDYRFAGYEAEVKKDGQEIAHGQAIDIYSKSIVFECVVIEL